MTPQTAPPLSLKNDGDSLVIEWSGGVTHRVPWRLLRKMCPCATCRTDRNKPPLPKSPLTVLSAAEAQPLRPVGMKPIGNYAYGIAFNDGHNTGIYSLDLLRQLGEQAGAAETPRSNS
jgi:DUF971 family protein